MELKPLTKLQIACGKILLECIAKGQYKIEYGKISKMTGIPAHLPGRDVGAQVGELSKHCHKLGLPLISAMVVLKETQMCSDGFFSLCNELNVHPEYKNKMGKMMEVCTRELQQCSRWGEFADYMHLSIEGLNVPKDALADNVQSEKVEGRQIQITATAYERDPMLRSECLRIHGAKCKICGFDASKVYGKEFIGKIHVHHIVPLGMVKDAHEVDPEKDLIPVCPNCHMILHSKKDGVFTPDEVAKMIERSKNR